MCCDLLTSGLSVRVCSSQQQLHPRSPHCELPRRQEHHEGLAAEQLRIWIDLGWWLCFLEVWPAPCRSREAAAAKYSAEAHSRHLLSVYFIIYLTVSFRLNSSVLISLSSSVWDPCRSSFNHSPYWAVLSPQLHSLCSWKSSLRFLGSLLTFDSLCGRQQVLIMLWILFIDCIGLCNYTAWLLLLSESTHPILDLRKPLRQEC